MNNILNNLTFKKNQKLLDRKGEVWLLINLVEMISLFDQTNQTYGFLFNSSTKKIKRVDIANLTSNYSPFLLEDESMAQKVMDLEKLLTLELDVPPTSKQD